MCLSSTQGKSAALCLLRDTPAAQAANDLKTCLTLVVSVRKENLTKNLGYTETDFFLIKNILMEIPYCSPEKKSYHGVETANSVNILMR